MCSREQHVSPWCRLKIEGVGGGQTTESYQRARGGYCMLSMPLTVRMTLCGSGKTKGSRAVEYGVGMSAPVTRYTGASR